MPSHASPRLYSYCIPVDDGAAPNPYWGSCTLAICKPRIRAAARVGDWIAGTGAKFARMGDGGTKDMSGRLVYAMKVTTKVTMAEYDGLTRSKLPNKVPAWRDPDHRRRLGDSIYDFSGGSPVQREGVHLPQNAATDLGGGHVLLSTHFFYFGDHAIELPDDLRAIAQNRQGHRVGLNHPLVDRFVLWLGGLGHEPGSVLGSPLLDLFENDACSRWCAATRAESDDQDEEIERDAPPC
jgi:hypothetical protein